MKVKKCENCRQFFLSISLKNLFTFHGSHKNFQKCFQILLLSSTDRGYQPQISLNSQTQAATSFIYTQQKTSKFATIFLLITHQIIYEMIVCDTKERTKR